MIAPGSALSVARQAKLLGVSRSSVYYRPRPDSQEELDLLKRLDELFTEKPGSDPSTVAIISRSSKGRTYEINNQRITRGRSFLGRFVSLRFVGTFAGSGVFRGTWVRENT
jgi:hypothetical protein